ncbi:MAG: hypothetical protein A2622_00355 [Bdellovibrionales bacterium RIFCSPHIGHO2_01_FULL_40_29]|nr:MAG: hypothetical protein A2622_00355 [Bdellovibrionales bacterium RIFCSPHIGHO2_01_FULL_40_29]OFZ32576.1 MAG: hypothetical protein A3D17_04955 [Bdellovibrionales bacterium RIFCSPHIGHO2_02_FULL_40_15]
MQNLDVVSSNDFSFLDQPEFVDRYATGPQKNHIQFYVGGIRCGKCVRKLEDLSIANPGIKQFRVDMGKNLADVEVDFSIFKFSTVADLISQMGFHPTPVMTDTSADDILNSEDRSELIRLAVAAVCAGNIMTYSFASYFGVTGDLQSVFVWLSFLLYLPVVSYVAWPFYVGAWNSLRQKQVSIDLPMAVASFAGFVFSTMQLLRGKDDIYFDSLSGFLFLILVSRWAQRRLQRRFLKSDSLGEALQLQRVRKVQNDSWAWTPLDLIKVDDRIIIGDAETLPGDAVLLSDKAYFGMAWLSGEVKAKTFLKGATVPAGARLVSGTAELRVTQLLSQTSFGQILQEVQRFSLTKNRIVSMADRWAQWLLVIVFSIGLIFLAAYWFVSPEEAIRRSLALIILACPCAMAFGTPLALTSALRKAQRKGLVIRSANVFERVQEVKSIFFDKTGTLTETELSLNESPALISAHQQKVILSLENESSHPMAFAFRKSFSASSLYTVQALVEFPGRGVSGLIDGVTYEIRKDDTAHSEMSCALYTDGKLSARFSFSAQLKPDCVETLRILRQKGYKLALLSGDKKEVVSRLATQLGFSDQEVFAEVSPAQKAQLIVDHPGSMMVGDGINDSLALIKSHVSVASSGGVEAAMRSSQVYLTTPSLRGITDLLTISKEAIGLIRQNLTISVIYNIATGTFALMGLVNPFVAAVLMPISSGFILLSTWLRSRK